MRAVSCLLLPVDSIAWLHAYELVEQLTDRFRLLHSMGDDME